MAQNILNEEELKMLLSTNYPKEEMIQPRRLRLTMKYLYQLIGEIQQGNKILVQRVDELEQQLYELVQIQVEKASTQEMVSAELADLIETSDPESSPTLEGPISITRSIRHPKPENPSFLSFLLHR